MQERKPRYNPDGYFERLDNLVPGDAGIIYPRSGSGHHRVRVVEIIKTGQEGNPAVRTAQGLFSGGTAVRRIWNLRG